MSELKFTMAPKKLYSFRADTALLNALRTRADEEQTTVSELMHRLLSEALGIENEKNQSPPINYQELEPLIEKLKNELKTELLQEIQTQEPKK